MRLEVCPETGTEAVRSDADAILCAALDVGEHLLKNGAEIRRVEDTIERICRAFGAVHAEVFVLTTLILASVRMSDGSYHQQMRRVRHSGVSLYMIEEMNALSRELCDGRVSLAEVRGRILAAKGRRPYTLWLSILGAVMFGFGSALFFGGSLRDGVCVALAGLVAFFLKRFMTSVNPLVATLFASFLSAAGALLLLRIGLGENIGPVMAGTVMFLVPGLAFGNSFRDMLGGDTLSGVMRMFHTLLLALMLALGFAAAIFLFDLTDAASQTGAEAVAWYILLFGAMLFALGYAIMNDLPSRRLLWVAIAALVVTGVYAVALPLGDFVTHLLAMLVVTLFCELAARLARTPVINFLTPAIIPLVPGGLLYYTVYFYITGAHDTALLYGNRTLAVCFGIAAGILLGTFAARLLLHRKHSKA